MATKYIYPRLPAIKTTSFIRYSGSGLCNSLFVFSRALVLSRKYGLRLINPTWLNFDPVQWRLWSKDKRTYHNLFKRIGLSGLRKSLYLLSHSVIKEENYLADPNGFSEKEGYVEIFLMKGFAPILEEVELVRESLLKTVYAKNLESVKAYDFTKTIAVHIRYGDYTTERLDGRWYKSLILQIHEKSPEYSFLVFSDGKDEELKDICELPFVKRHYFGSSISDLFAISSCCALIGSHSTFTDWGGYLGQIPSLLPKEPHYGGFLLDKRKEFIIGLEPVVPDGFFDYLR